jgi:4-hydroxymandelate oxidase
MVGRPVLWALTNGGERGVATFLSNMVAETVNAMALCGLTRVAQATSEMLRPNAAAKL